MGSSVPNLSEAFATVVQHRRTAGKLSRETLAQRAGLHQTYIGLIERGLRNPSLDAAQAIAAALGQPLSKLISEAERARKGGKSR